MAVPASSPAYLRPYHDAHRRRARGVRAMLYDDAEAQAVRFAALARICPLAGLSVLDVGCGRADFLGFLRARGIAPAHYTGLEALPWLARAARRRGYADCTIVEGDFVRQPALLAQGADVVLFSGSLNLLSSRRFYRTLEQGWAAARRWLVFIFLCSTMEAGAPFLHWHRKRRVLAFARPRAAQVLLDDGYRDGDCTVAMRKT
jgi:hypothetical protein